MNKIIFKILILLHRLVKGIANRVLDKKTIRPRDFSNAMLKKYAHHFSGSVINVSGWMDEDGQGSHYKKYFTKHTSYTVSNVRGQGKGFGSASLAGYQEIELDLLKDLPVSLEKKFDVVFNHTTLEHIYEFKKAFNNICALSNDAVIIVVPVMQQIHHTKDFGDYWRPTTMTIAKLFKDNGFKPVIIECNEQPFAPIYCFAIALRDKSKHPTLTPHINFQMGAYNYGSSLKQEFIEELLK